MNQTELYDHITGRIVAALEAGTAPWVRPWRSVASSGREPQNAQTNRPYSGINFVLLSMEQAAMGYEHARWLTAIQAARRGGTIRAGERGTIVVYAGHGTSEDASDERRQFGFLKAYEVWNVAQCDDLPDAVVRGRYAEIPEAGPETEHQRLPIVDDFVATTRARIRHAGAEAFYAPGGDYIAMPPLVAFRSSQSYYATLLHELVHWTGHHSRLDRFSRASARFGDQAYAAEELIAELGAAFVCAEFGIDGDLRHASYIASWVRLLRSDPRAIVTAASRAQQAVNHLRELAIAAVAELPDTPTIGDRWAQSGMPLVGSPELEVAA